MPVPIRLLLLSGFLVVASHTARAQNPAASQEKIYAYVEQMPVFPGGQPALLTSITQLIKYPEEALKQRIEGKVFVSFVVSPTGEVQKAQVVRSVHPLLDAEALRAVSALPAWVPGRQAGKAVPVAFTVPIIFSVPPAEAGVARLASSSGRPPRVVGGQEALEAYLRSWKQYPEAAKAANASGLVFVTVKVDSLNRVTRVKAMPGLSEKQARRQTQTTAYAPHPALLAAAEELLRNGPAWEVAQIKGQPKSASHLLPLVFDAASGTVSLLPRVRLFPDELATTDGGRTEVSNLIGRNVKYPPAALRARTGGTVQVFFEVNEQGLAENPRVIHSVSAELDAESLRAVSAMPAVLPALEKGQPVRSYYAVPLTFKIR